MTPTQKDMMLHALGGSLKSSYRNYYCAAVGQPDDLAWKELVALGLAQAGETINEGKARYYRVTAAGVEALKAEGKL